MTAKLLGLVAGRIDTDLPCIKFMNIGTIKVQHIGIPWYSDIEWT